MIDRSGILTAPAESEASANLNCQIRMPKLRYFAEASAFFPKLYQKKLENCTNNTAKVSKMVKKYAFASVTSPPKLLLQKLLPNSSAEALAGARFGRSLKEMHHLVYIPFCVWVAIQLAKKQLGGLLGAYLGAYLGAFPV